MVTLLVYLVILVIVCIFLYWLMNQVTLPEPLHKIATIVLVTIAVVVLIGMLVHVSGVPLPQFPRN